jgi:TIR domain
MWHILPTEQWIDGVVKFINENQLKLEDSKFMMAFFSSMDTKFVEYFQKNKKQISSFSGYNFHIFTPLIYEDKVIPDEHWRYMRSEFNSLGIPVKTEPTFVFFNLDNRRHDKYQPTFFAGFECSSFNDFPRKLKNAIDKSIETKDTRQLADKLSEIFLSQNIIPFDRVNNQLKQTITSKLPTSTIFISHSSVDKPFVKRLEAELSKDKSLKFWIDENEILAGEDIQKSISKSLSSSDYLLLVISDNSTKSSWVNFEVSQFMSFADGKNIIPIVVSKGQKFSEPIDNLIRRLKYLDFSNDNNWDKNIASIKRALTGVGIDMQIKNKTVNFNSKVETAIVGDKNKITIKQTKKTVKEKYPPDCIGYDTIKANYIGHLINRYNEYKEYEVGKGQVKYAVFAGHLKKQFKIAPTRTLYNLHIDKFDELVDYIHSRIDGTKLAKVKGREHKNYSTYDEFAAGQK